MRTCRYVVLSLLCSLALTVAAQQPPAASNATLNGTYAFTFSGYKSGAPVIMAGSFVADGAGHLTSGLLDYNDGSGEPLSGLNIIPQTLASGSVYSISGSGLGTMTIVTNLATYKFAIAVAAGACSINAQFLSTCGRLIESDAAHPQDYGSGVIKVQNPQYFPVTSFFPGNFAFEYVGTDPSGNRYAGAGAFGTNSSTLVDIDCSTDRGGNGWGLLSCPSDANDAGQAAANPINGTFSSTIDQHTGRGNFADLTFPSDPEGRCTHHWCDFAFYIVDKSEMILIATDPISTPANMTLWLAVRQTSNSGWSLASLSGASIPELSAVAPNGGSPLPDITAGWLLASASGNGTLFFDRNRGGTLSLQQSTHGGYAIDTLGQKTGRMTMSGFSSLFGTTPPVLYLIGTNNAFVVGTDAEATSGLLEPQVGTPSNNSVNGIYAGGSSAPGVSAVTNSVAAMFANGVGTIAATQDTSGPGGPAGPNSFILGFQVDPTGRAVVTERGVRYGVLYVVSPAKFVMLPVGSDPVLSVFADGPTN